MNGINWRFLVVSLASAAVVAPVLFLAGDADARKRRIGDGQINVKARDHTAGVAVDRAHRDVRDHRGEPPAIRDRLANPRRGFHSPKRKMQVRDHRDGQ